MHDIVEAAMPDKKTEQKSADAALSDWERGEGDTPAPAPHPERARLKTLFETHTDVCTLAHLLNDAMNDASDPVPVTVEVQPGLLRLLGYIESLDAAATGRPPAPAERLLHQIVGNHAENLLHLLATDPTSHPHFAKLWNALCAEQGQTDYQVPDGSPQTLSDKAGEAPF
ncbi:MAG: hypothetical protein WCZ66_05185 [Sphingomonadaceae bacterium]